MLVCIKLKQTETYEWSWFNDEGIFAYCASVLWLLSTVVARSKKIGLKMWYIFYLYIILPYYFVSFKHHCRIIFVI